MKIGIDIDGTVTNNFKLIKDLSCSYFKKPESEITGWHWDFCKVFDITPQEAQTFWDIHEKEIYSIPGPHAGAVEVITKLSATHEIIYITARTEGFKEETIQWLKKHDIYFNNLYLAKDKQKICLDKNISLLIDDSPEYVSIADSIPLIMFNYPYNKHCQHRQLFKVDCWFEIDNLIENLNFTTN